MSFHLHAYAISHRRKSVGSTFDHAFGKGRKMRLRIGNGDT